jgi:hypothetical protein
VFLDNLKLSIQLYYFSLGWLVVPRFIVFRPKRAVIAGMKQTLDLLALSYEETPGNLTIDKTGTRIRIESALNITLLIFELRQNNNEKEAYLRRTLLKFLRNV